MHNALKEFQYVVKIQSDVTPVVTCYSITWQGQSDSSQHTVLMAAAWMKARALVFYRLIFCTVTQRQENDHHTLDADTTANRCKCIKYIRAASVTDRASPPVYLHWSCVSVRCSHVESICMKIHMHDVTFWPSLLFWQQVTAINTHFFHLNNTVSRHNCIMQNISPSFMDKKKKRLAKCKMKSIIRLPYIYFVNIMIGHGIPFD